MMLCAVVALTAQPVAVAGSAATVTATPPPQVAVKPLSARQARERHCAQLAREHGIAASGTQAYVEACMKHRPS
jgi:hypothetical protein